MGLISIGYNPNLDVDIKRLFNLSSDIATIGLYRSELEKIKPSYYDRLLALVDKLEFIEHLEFIKEFSIGNNYIVGDKEVSGIDNDIDALNLYLALSCIDMFSNVMKYEPFEEWILDNCEDFDTIFAKDSIPLDMNMQLKKYIESKSIEYKKSYGVSSNFRDAICKSSEATALTENLTVLYNCKSSGVRQNNDHKREIGLTYSDESNNIVEIAEFLKNIRNKYTHEGKRVYYGSFLMIGASIRGWSIVIPNNRMLRVSRGFDLLSSIKHIAIEQCKYKLSRIKVGECSLIFPK